MWSPSYHASSDRPRLTRQRAVAILLAILIEGLVAIALLKLGSFGRPPKKPDNALSTFQLLPESPVSSKPTSRSKAETKGVAKQAPPPRPHPEPPPKAPPAFIELSSSEFASADISKLPSVSKSGPSGDAAGKGSAAPYGPGEGPGGQPLYNAEWYREPTRGEMALYLPALPRSGWGLIVCRTIEKYHVDNCQAIGEDPPGTGLARAMRQASWQFLVRPPRIGGKTLIGAWVRIRFDLRVSEAKDR